MALQALGMVARFLLSKGTREAVVKFGRAAVDKAKKEIAKRSRTIDEKAAQAARAEGRNPLSSKGHPATQKAMQEGRSKAGRQRRLEGKPSKGTRNPPNPEQGLLEEVPLRFAKGGGIDGKAIKGLTKGSRRR